MPDEKKTEKTEKQYSYRHAQPPEDEPHEYITDKDSELIIALVAAVGTDLSAITSVLSDRLKTFSYKATEIKISNHIIAEIRDIPSTPHFERVSALMSEGNYLRKGTGDNAILAKLAAAKINEIRINSRPANLPEGTLAPMPRRAFIVSLNIQLKLLPCGKFTQMASFLLAFMATNRCGLIISVVTKKSQISRLNSCLKEIKMSGKSTVSILVTHIIFPTSLLIMARTGISSKKMFGVF